MTHETKTKRFRERNPDKVRSLLTQIFTYRETPFLDMRHRGIPIRKPIGNRVPDRRGTF